MSLTAAAGALSRVAPTDQSAAGLRECCRPTFPPSPVSTSDSTVCPSTPYRAIASRLGRMVRFGWPESCSTSRSATPGTCAITLRISSPFSCSTFRSSPKSLIASSPFTPESASSTLSSMYCEKLKSHAGKLLQLVAHLLDQALLVDDVSVWVRG